MNDDFAELIDEPLLEFRYSQKLASPHDGLAMFGPYDADLPSAPKSISFGVVGTENGIEECCDFFKLIGKPIMPQDEKQKISLWPAYPGFSTAFDSILPSIPTKRFALESTKLSEASRDLDPNKRAGTVVDMYIDGIKRLIDFDEHYNVIVCVVPDEIYRNCRPQSIVHEGIGIKTPLKLRNQRAAGQQELFGSFAQEHYLYSVDFRRQIKARSMEYGVPIQILRESTFFKGKTDESTRGLTPLTDRAWNLSVGLYYKSGGKPWKLASARDGVCYIGIAYRRTGKEPGSKTACSAAQMFLDSGDGIVLMGEQGKWYSPETKEFHLNRHAARRLLSNVLNTYQKLEGKPLTEIFLHCRSTIDDEEFAGFNDACPKGSRLIGIRVRKQRGVTARLFREGKNPVLRGTWWKQNDNSCLLWANGYKPRLKTYDGWETPLPLRIDIQHGSGDIRQVAVDILSLSKLDFNSCKFSLSEPVTIGFSDAVGEILVSNPTVTNANPKFKFYI
jgi:hypothetical protein